MSATPNPYRAVCSWCDVEIRPGCEPVSHGCCEKCRDEMIALAGGVVVESALPAAQNEIIAQGLQAAAQRHVAAMAKPAATSANGVTCDVCGGFVPGHATGAGDICECEPICAGAAQAKCVIAVEPHGCEAFDETSHALDDLAAAYAACPRCSYVCHASWTKCTHCKARLGVTRIDWRNVGETAGAVVLIAILLAALIMALWL